VAEMHYLKLKDSIKFMTVYPMVVDTRLITDVAGHCVYKHRFHPMITTDDVANAVVNGVLTNQRFVFVPWDAKLMPWLSLTLPLKAQRYISDFMGMGFVSKK